MKIALVDAYYLPGQGYQSGPLYRHLVKQGHQVRMICSCYAPVTMRGVFPKPFPEGVVEEGGGEVHRLTSRLLPRNMVSCNKVAEAVQQFCPDMTYVIYVNTFFGHELFEKRGSLTGALFGGFGEHSMQRWVAMPSLPDWLKNAILDAAFWLKKRPLSRRCIEVSDAALFATPDTFDYILSRVASGKARDELRKRCALYPLGFDPDVYRFDEQLRRQTRQRLGFGGDDLVVVHACKVIPSKELHDWIAIVEGAMRVVPQIRGVLVGAREGEPETERLRGVIRSSKFAERFTFAPFAVREELAAMYNMADLGVWFFETSITIQEAMGTGLYMLVNKNLALAHLLEEPHIGRYAEDQNYPQLTELLIKTAEEFLRDRRLSGPAARTERAAASRRRFGYDVLAHRLVEAAGDPANAVALLEGGNAWGQLPKR